MKNILIHILFFTGLIGQAQSPLLEVVELESSENRWFAGVGKERLASELLTGFEAGKITGYAKGPEVVSIFGKERIELPYPQFEQGTKYYASDIVKFNGKYFEATINTSSPPDKEPTHWQEYENFVREGEKVQYPAEAEKISYEQWGQMTVAGFAQGYLNNAEYYSDDIVLFEGQCYVALQDSQGKDPSRHGEFWKKCDRSLYLTPRQIDKISVVYSPSDMREDTAYIALIGTDRSRLFFRLDEIKKHLNIK